MLADPLGFLYVLERLLTEGIVDMVVPEVVLVSRRCSGAPLAAAIDVESTLVHERYGWALRGHVLDRRKHVKLRPGLAFRRVLVSFALFCHNMCSVNPVARFAVVDW